MGDYADFINISDKRCDIATLATWIGRQELVDLARAQKERFMHYVRPIAGKCLAMVKGNHEDTILKKYERDIYLEIVSEIKTAGGMKADEQLALDYYGWLKLVFYRGKDADAVTTINGNLHHGFTNGKLAGAKALNMQRWLWTHDCDFAIFGHSHNTMAQVETVETLDRGDNVIYHVRRGGFSGTFMRTTTPDMPSGYAERKGYFPMPLGGCELYLKPGAKDPNERVRILT
jgi:predicted phosphodiesterase